MEGMLFAPVIILIVGAAFLWMPLQYVRQRKRLTESGERTQAVVTTVSERRVRRNDRWISQFEHTLEYSAGGMPYTGKTTSGTPVAAGSVIEIIYNLDNPQEIMTADQIDNASKINVLLGLFAAIGAILIIVAVVILLVRFT